jgi:hypothetical protein
MPDDERLILEALEALHYCTAEFLPMSEVVQSACRGSSRNVLSRFKQRLMIAQRLGYLEFLQHGATKLVRLTQAGLAAIETHTHRAREQGK